MRNPINNSRYSQLLRFRNETGAALIFCLIVLLILLMLGASLATTSVTGEKSVHNEYDQQLAFFAAESALTDAELDIENSQSEGSRSAIFSPDSREGFVLGCGRGNGNVYQGLCLTSKPAAKPIWLSCDIANALGSAASVEFGRFTGKKLPTSKGPLPSQKPRYIIELIADQTTGQAANLAYMYRITAIGFGATTSTQVVLQTVYRKSLR